jgi:hypothetical protein
MRFLLPLFALLTVTPGASAAPGVEPATLESLRAADARLAGIAYRLTTRNAALCRDLEPELGLQFHTLAQYQPAARGSARTVFGFAAPVAVELVLPESPAGQAGARPDDALLAIDGAPLDTPAPGDAPASTGVRDALFARLAARAPDRPIRLTLAGAPGRRDLSITPIPACRALAEVTFERDSYALESGIIAIAARSIERFDEQGLAVVMAHELGHLILKTQARLAAAGVKSGALVGELGRNARLRKQGELEADELAVALLYNAGYPVDLAARFYRGPGRALDYGLFRDRGTPARSERIKVSEAAAAAIPPGAARPVVPAILAARDRPME